MLPPRCRMTSDYAPLSMYVSLHPGPTHSATKLVARAKFRPVPGAEKSTSFPPFSSRLMLICHSPANRSSILTAPLCPHRRLPDTFRDAEQARHGVGCVNPFGLCPRREARKDSDGQSGNQIGRAHV